MSKITEYMSLIPKILENRTKIVEGIINNVKLQFSLLEEEEQKEIIRRRLICHTCPFMSENAKIDKYQNYKTERSDEHCSICQCNIELKTASLESNCGIEVLNEQKNSNIPLKWETFKK